MKKAARKLIFTRYFIGRTMGWMLVELMVQKKNRDPLPVSAWIRKLPMQMLFPLSGLKRIFCVLSLFPLLPMGSKLIELFHVKYSINCNSFCFTLPTYFFTWKGLIPTPYLSTLIRACNQLRNSLQHLHLLILLANCVILFFVWENLH